MLTREQQVAGGKARARQFTHESQSRAGKLGYQATLKKYGYESIWKRMVAWRKDNPSGPEQAMIQRLREWFGWEQDRDYQREYRAINGQFLILDFAFTSIDGAKAIEIQGRVHRLPELDPDGKRALWDMERRAMLEAAGWDILYLDDDEIAGAEGAIREHLGL